MISDDIAQQVVDIATLIGPREKAEAEVTLRAMLHKMETDLRSSKVSAMLQITVSNSFFDRYREEARQDMKQEQQSKV